MRHNALLVNPGDNVGVVLTELRAAGRSGFRTGRSLPLPGTSRAGIGIVRRFMNDVRRLSRCACPVDCICLGLQCGGSDAFSGISANPVAGPVSDWLAPLFWRL